MEKMPIIICLVFLMIGSVGYAYSPPVGIPDPGWGIDEVMPSRPSGWTTDPGSEVTGYYYINHGTGSDTGRTYGCPSAPRKTVPNPILKGSYIEIHGDYAPANPIVFNGAGENAPNGNTWSAGSDGPAWITMKVDGEYVGQLTSYLAIVWGSYVYLDGIKCYGRNFQIGRPALSYAADHIMVRNSTLDGNSGNFSALAVQGVSGNEIQNIILYNNSIYHYGPYTLEGEADTDYVGVMLHSYVDYAWVLQNTIYGMAGGGIAAGQYGQDAESERPTHLYYGRNTIYDTLATGMSCKDSDVVIMSENTVHDMRDNTGAPSGSPSGCAKAQYNASEVWIINNILYGTMFGIYIGGTDGDDTNEKLYIVGNVVYNNSWQNGNENTTEFPATSRPTGCMQLSGFDYRYVVGNTCVNNDSGINTGESDAYIVIENNIIYDITESDGEHIWVLSAIDPDKTWIRNNSIYEPGGTEEILWGGTTYTVATLPAKHTGNISSDPTLDISYHLISGSPAIDAALTSTSLTLDVYATFLSSYSLSIATDRSGTSRPQGDGWDIGAYEYVSKPGTVSFRAPQAGDGSMQRAVGGTGSITY